MYLVKILIMITCYRLIQPEVRFSFVLQDAYLLDYFLPNCHLAAKEKEKEAKEKIKEKSTESVKKKVLQNIMASRLGRTMISNTHKNFQM